MNWLAVGLVVAAPAWAQLDAGVVKVGRPARAAPLKAVGSAKEDDDEPPRPPAVKAPASDADLGLLRAVLYAFEPAPTEIRVIAIEDLGLLGDSRGLNPLAQLVMDPNPAVQLAAVRAIASIQHPRAEAILSNIVRHPTLGEKIKVAAVDALIFQNSPTSVAFLAFLTRAGGFHPVLQQQARRALAELPAGRSL